MIGPEDELDELETEEAECLYCGAAMVEGFCPNDCFGEREEHYGPWDEEVA